MLNVILENDNLGDTSYPESITSPHDLVIELDFFTKLREVSIKHLRRIWHDDRWHLLILTSSLYEYPLA